MAICLSALLAFMLACPVAVAGQGRIDQLAQEGWEAIKKGDGEKAVLAFREAVILDPNDAMLHLGAGWAARLLGRDLDARASLRKALSIDPKLAPAAIFLGQLAYESGELDLAIRSYEQALAAAEDPRIRGTLEEWKREADVHNSFQEEPSTHFTVLFEGPEERQLAQRVLGTLESGYWRIGRALNWYPPDVIPVILYTREQFRDITRTPGWVNGAYDGRIRVPVRGALENQSELDRVLIHELVHAIVRSVGGREVPTWLNEGLAVVFEESDLGWAERRVKQAPSLIPLSDLAGSFMGFDAQRAALAYAESALAARFLFERLGESLPQLLQEIGHGQPVDAALGRLDIGLTDFQSAWEQSVGRRQ